MKLHRLGVNDMNFFSGLYVEGCYWSPSTILTPDFVSAVQAPDAVWLHDERGAALGGLERINLIDRVCEPFVAVTADNRRRGLGLELGKAMVQYAKNTLNLRLARSTILEDAPSRGILEALGFVHTGTHPGVRFRDGKYITALSYQLEL